MVKRSHKKWQEERRRRKKKKYTWHNRLERYDMCEKRKFEEEDYLMANLQRKWVDVFYHLIRSICEVFFHITLFIHSFKSNTKAHLERKWKIVKSLTHFFHLTFCFFFWFFSLSSFEYTRTIFKRWCIKIKNIKQGV